MKLLIFFVLALAITVPTAHGQGRILNGQAAKLGQFPYQARMDLEDEKGKLTSCGGSLISPNYILTAAHCLKNKVNATVYLGAINRYEAEAYRYVSRLDFIVHDRYNNTTKANDIALIKIPTVEYTDNIQPVKLPKLKEKNKFRYETVIVTGWGRNGTSETAPLPKLLQWTRLTVLSNNDCRRKHSYKGYIRRSNLCANSLKSRVCKGDSGSPVVLERTRVQIAIVSRGSQKGCEARLPSIFVRITKFLKWIKNNSDVSF